MLNNYRQALTNKYARDYDMDLAYDTGIISFTSKCTSGLPGTGHPIGEWYTVVVETSDDKDANGYHFIRQTAFYRNTGGSVLDQTKLKNSVWVRYMFGIKGGSNSLTSKTVSPWIEVSNSYLNANQMASYHGVIDEIDYWHYNPDDALKQGIYPTCGNEFVFDSKGNTVFTLGGFCTVIVINSTLPDSTGYSTVEQTAYGRDGDNGKIYKRILFIHDTEPTISGNWTRIDSCGRETENYTRYGWGIDVNTNAIYTGACAYTPAVIDGIDGNWTIFVNRTVDTDGDGTNGYYHLTQTAYYRDGIANIPSGTKFERMGWYKIEGRDSENNPNIVDLNFTPWMSTYKFVTVDTLSEFVTFDALESLYYATNDYVDQKVAGITGGTVVSWGTTSNNTSPLTVAGTSKTVSLSGHTHSYAPIAHASSATTYGVATTANYGHVKISNGDCNTVASANGLAAGMDHTHGNYATTTALASYLPLAGGNLTGPVTSTSTITATAFYQRSDRNLKDNIQLLQQDILDKIYNTNEVTFTWKSTGERAYGYIAQDM